MQRFGIEADWFAVGAVLFELYAKQMAFPSGKTDVLTNDPAQHLVSVCCSPRAKDLIARLLCKNSQLRLGHGGSDEIKNHPWFAVMNWNDLQLATGKEKSNVVFVPDGPSEEALLARIPAPEAQVVLTEQQQWSFRQWDWWPDMPPRRYVSEEARFR